MKTPEAAEAKFWTDRPSTDGGGLGRILRLGVALVAAVLAALMVRAVLVARTRAELVNGSEVEV